MKYTLGLGSNLGDRFAHLERALAELQIVGSSIRVSSVYETPALLPDGAEPAWNVPYMNLAAEIDCELPPERFHRSTKEIEASIGRDRGPRWAPREIDIDILMADGIQLESESLRIPHPSIGDRAFVLDPLKDLDPKFLSAARSHPLHSPVWMAILNLTPDSFSDGGLLSSEAAMIERLKSLEGLPIGILDIGGESTRPGAVPVSPDEEWQRIHWGIRCVQEFYRGRRLRPLVSVDTRHSLTALRAIEMGVDLINDVSGLKDERFIDLLRSSECAYVLMHPGPFTGIPEMKRWFRQKIDLLTTRGIRPERVIVDPGIGFGKTSIESLSLLKSLGGLHSLDHRILVGHSRKSFMKSFAGVDRELESVGVSLHLIEQGVDILRVHDPLSHIRAHRGWSHVRT